LEIESTREAGSRWRPAGATVLAAALAGALVAVVAPSARADAIDELAGAVARFRGIGSDSVDAYVVTMTLPDEQDDPITLLEAWRAPSDLVLAAAEPDVPRAIVRSWAVFLEPMYVARTSLLGIDLDAGAERLRATAHISRQAIASGGARIRITLGAIADPQLPDMLRDVLHLDATLDARGRIDSLTVDLRGQSPDAPERIRLACVYDSPQGELPELAEWTLPDGRPVRVSTTFRMEGEHRVPRERHIVFPSRWDPGETEEILVRYGTYEFGRERVAERLEGRESFRYDANGLVGD
jgi:hypothetical protein